MKLNTHDLTPTLTFKQSFVKLGKFGSNTKAFSVLGDSRRRGQSPQLKSQCQGFTLVEILVAVSLMAILASVLFVNFGDARTHARNRTLQTEIKETQLALELYKAQNGRYPEAGNPDFNCSAASGGVNQSTSQDCVNGSIVFPFIDSLAPEYIAELPTHDSSSNNGCDIIYKVEDPGGQWYKLTAANCFGGADSASEGVRPDDKMARCPSSCSSCDGNNMSAYVNNANFYESFAVYSAGGECR
ncbi:type II secretion system protein [Candidatus Kaiserbacteria bacterium]|nr:type II secretion system protein [Candidatus Kaiserbacteria bacterium]